MKRMLLLVAGAVLVAGSAWAVPLNPYVTRNVTINPAYSGENSLQEELDAAWGSGVVSAADDQLGVGMFQVGIPGSHAILPQFKFEWTSGAGSQTVGIFGWDSASGTTVDATIFSGAQGAGDTAMVNWLTADSGTIWSGGASTSFSGISKNFFGFSFTTGGGTTYYSVDSLNPNGEARVLGFQPNLLGALFSYEDGSDFDYQDAGFLVESISPVPEPATMILLGSGLIGLAGTARRKKSKKS